ncbi:MAG: hypothetical protein ACP5OO_02260 [Chloroflexia bacterium]
MEEGRMVKYRMGYEKLLQAVGRFCDEQKLDEICVMEFEKGLILRALQVESTGEGYIRRAVSYTWSYEQVAGMVPPPPAPSGGRPERGGKP